LTQSNESCRAIESELAGTKELMAWNSQVLADSLERSRVLKEDLGQLQGTARSVVNEVLGAHQGSSVLIDDLPEIPGEVAGLITNGVFHHTLRVLTLVASYHPTLNFEAVRRGYVVGWSVDQLRELGQSLAPVATAIAEVTTAEWVREARHAERAETAVSHGSCVECRLDRAGS
jgi:hypothetical protein